MPDVLLHEVISQIFRHVRQVLLSNSDADLTELFGSNPGSQVWSKIMGAIKDPYTVERMSELLLHQLASEHVTDVEAYWIIWLMFHQIFYQQTSVRSVDKLTIYFLLPCEEISLSACLSLVALDHPEFNKVTIDNSFHVKLNGMKP